MRAKLWDSWRCLALLMRFMHRRADLFENIHHPFERQSLFLNQDVGERATVEIFHHEIRDGFCAGVRETEIGDVNAGGVPIVSVSHYGSELMPYLDIKTPSSSLVQHSP